MKQFLILAETGNLGYYVQIVSDLETAIIRENLFFELAFNPPTDHEKLREEFKPIGTYSVGKELSLITNTLGGTSNGIDATYIIEIDEGFNFEQFALSRNRPSNVT